MKQSSNPERMRKIIIASFLSVPVLASLISTLHLVNFFYLGNHGWMSYVLAVTFEVGSIASFVSLGILTKIRKWAVYTIFVILLFMQLIGNVYFTFEYVNRQLASDPAFLNSFVEMVRPVYDAESISDYKFVLALMIGVAIPLVSILFLKSLVDYLSLPEEKEKTDTVDAAVEPHKADSPEDISEDLDLSVESMEAIRDVQPSAFKEPEQPVSGGSGGDGDDFAAIHQNNQ